MKGIILSAGEGKRLYPLTKGIPKTLLPVYDRPMIYFALEFMKSIGIEEVIIAVNSQSKDIFEKAIGEGCDIDISISLVVISEIKGTAWTIKEISERLVLDEVVVYYGDNVLIGDNVLALAEIGFQNLKKGYASLLTTRVDNPEAYGVVEFSSDGEILSLEEKPAKPKSNYIATGIYFYPSDLVEKLSKVSISLRGEYEMTDVINMYLEENRLKAVPLPEEFEWFDTGTPDLLLEAANRVRMREKKEGVK